MSRVKIKLADNIARVIFIEKDATIGATIGTDLRMPDGTLATAASLAAYIGFDSSGSGIRDHRLLRGLTLGDDHPQYVRKDTLTTRGDLYVRDATTVVRKALGTVGQLLRSDGTDPQWATLSPVITLGTDLSGSVTLTDLGNGTLNATIVNNAVTDAKLRDSGGLSVIGRAASTTGDPADILAASDGDVLRRSGATVGFGDIVLRTSNFANPSGLIGMAAVNGSALTAQRSDSTHAIDPAIAPIWTGQHVWTGSASETLLIMRNPSAGADLKNVVFRTGTGGQFQVWSATDAAPTSVVTSIFNTTRSGTAWATMTFGQTTDNPTFSFNGSGQLSKNGNLIPDVTSVPVWTNLHTFSRSSSETLVAMHILSAAADAKNTLFRLNSGGAFGIWSAADATPSTAVTPFLTATRTGAAWASISIGQTTDNPTINFNSTARSTFSGVLRLKGYTVATLPAGTVGDTAYVTDALAPAFGANVAGGGAVTIPVFYDGANWIVG